MGDSQGFFGTGFAHAKKSFQGVDPGMPIVYTSGMGNNLTEIEIMTTYTGRVYDCFGEILWEVEGESVEIVERDILDTWTGCVEAKGYAVINDDDGSEEAVEEFPRVPLAKMWSEFGDF